MSQTTTLEAPAPAAAPQSRYTKVPSPWLTVLWPVAALVLLLLFDLLFVPNFFRISISQGHLSGSLVDVFRLAAPVMLVSVGMTLVLATGGVDLSVGAIMALAGAVAAKLMTEPTNLSPWLAALAALGLAILCGAWNGALVALLDIQPIVATLVLMIAGRGLAMEFVGSGYVDVHGTLFDRLHGYIIGLPAAGLLALLVFAGTGAFTRVTSAGLLIEATGANKVASRFAGVNVLLVTFLTYVFSGLCSGLAGLVAAADIQKANAIHTGMYLELDAILATVIGGTSLTGGRFSIVGALVGALLIQTLATTLTYRVPVEYTLVVKAVVVLAVCLLQSDTVRRKVFRRGASA